MFDAAGLEDGVEVADVALDDLDVLPSGETLLQDLGEVGVAFDCDEGGVGFYFADDLVGDGSSAGAEFDDDFGVVPVDLFDGGFGEGFGGGPDRGDAGAVAEKFRQEVEVVLHQVFGDVRGVGGGVGGMRHVIRPSQRIRR